MLSLGDLDIESHSLSLTRDDGSIRWSATNFDPLGERYGLGLNYNGAGAGIGPPDSPFTRLGLIAQVIPEPSATTLLLVGALTVGLRGRHWFDKKLGSAEA